MMARVNVLALTIIFLWIGHSAAKRSRSGSKSRCKFTIEKDGHQLINGSTVVAFEKRLNQLTCRLACPGVHATPALTWYKGGMDGMRIPEMRWRVNSSPSMDRRSSILYIRHLTSWDMGVYTCSAFMSGYGLVTKSVRLVKDCNETMLLCDMSRCVDRMKECDGVQDCQDGSDEKICSAGCHRDEITCDEKCVSLDKQCNGYHDCSDGMDEQDCPCLGYICLDGTCINNGTVCDGNNDCPVGEDELDCPEHPFTADLYDLYGHDKPDDYHVVDYGDVSISDDVYDHSMDTHFDYSPEDKPDDYHAGEFDDVSIIDGVYDHSMDTHFDNSPEDKPDDYHAGEFDDVSIIDDVYDHSMDTHFDNSPEDNEVFHVADSEEVTIIHDVYDDCMDIGCDNSFPSEGYECHDGKCIAHEEVCDGVYDCPRGEDEIDCPGFDHEYSDEFYLNYDNDVNETVAGCQGDDIMCDENCVTFAHQCDGYNDCSDGMDEEGCPCVDFTCPEGTCVTYDQLCDDHFDCIGGEDELECQGHDYYDDIFGHYNCDDCFNDTAVYDDYMDMGNDNSSSEEESAPNPVPMTTATTKKPVKKTTTHKFVPHTTTQKYVRQTTTQKTVPTTGKPCGTGYTVCLDGFTCYLNEYKCDGYVDCADEDDEKDCNNAVVEASVTTDTGNTKIWDGDSVVFKCNVTQIPRRYTVVKGIISRKYDNKPNMFSESAPESTVTFTTKVTSEWHEAKFTCKAKAAPRWKDKERSLKLLVHHGPKSLTILYKNSTRATAGQSTSLIIDRAEASQKIQLTCVVEGGYPSPNVAWRVGNTVVAKDAVSSDNTYTLSYVIDTPSQVIGQQITCVAAFPRKLGLSANVKLVTSDSGLESCAEGMFRCINNSACIPNSRVCNGRLDCSDGTDEHGCGGEMTPH